MELSKQEMEIFLPFLDIGSKNFFKKSIPIWARIPKCFTETGNGIIYTGNGIISPLSSHRIKKLL
jgi:hypothetical protein